MRVVVYPVAVALAILACGSFGTTPANQAAGDASSTNDTSIITDASFDVRAFLDGTPGEGPLTDDLVLWYAADQAVSANNGRVEAWNNLVSNAGHATATGDARPTILANILNGRPAIRFDGADNGLGFTFDITNEQKLTLVIVAATETSTTPGVNTACLSWSEKAAWGLTYVSPGQTELSFRFGTLQPDNDVNVDRLTSVATSFTRTVAIHDGVEDRLYINGEDVTTADGKVARINGTTGSGFIGRGHKGGFTGMVAEILVYKRAVATPGRDRNEDYLKAKYFP
jgi:hypothetical protein